MTTKYLSVSLFLLFFGLQSCFGQKGAFDLSFDVGYGSTAAPYTEVVRANGISSNVTYSLGRGLNLGLGGVYMVGEHIGLGINLDYLAGNKTQFVYSNDNVTTTTYVSGNLFSFTPHIMVSANTGPVNPYGKFGLVFGSATVTATSTEAGNKAFYGTDITKYSGNSAMGWYGAFGLQIAISDNLMINAEVYNRTIAYAPKSAENTQAYDGEQKYPTITYAKTTDNNSSNYTENQIYWPYSSVGVMVGITMRFGAGK